MSENTEQNIVENKRKYSAEEIRRASHSDDQPLDEAVFPYYGVKCVYPGGKVVEEIYPEGMEEYVMPWERTDNGKSI